MNPISAFLVQQMVGVYFIYGLAFFSLGLALLLAGRQVSRFRFARAIPAFAVFGIVHGIHEWFEMYQKIAALTQGHIPTVLEETIRLAILAASFLALSAFGIRLLKPEPVTRREIYLPLLGMGGLWLASTLISVIVLQSAPQEIIAVADVLSRYCLGIPSALLGAWALMVQQRTFREHGMPEFGRDLVWCTTALLLYGVVGQSFVRPSPLAPSTFLNSTLFFQWFGIPVQLFRAAMAAIMAIFLVRALNAFDVEGQRLLEAANAEKLAAQTNALEAQRRSGRRMERLNEELRLATHELSLLLGLSNVLAASISLPDRLLTVLTEIVQSLSFPDAGMILLVNRHSNALEMQALAGFENSVTAGTTRQRYQAALDLGRQCVARQKAMCRHRDGCLIEFLPEEVTERQKCREHSSPVQTISLPIAEQHRVIGSLVLDQAGANGGRSLSPEEFSLMAAATQQLGMSIENARLSEEAHERERRLSELLRQAVGAQEAERQRIARELHDSTGQSLTAVALGLRGMETMLLADPSAASEQMRELQSFCTGALRELRRIIADLRPSQLDDLGLVAAVDWYVREFEERSDVSTKLVIKGDPFRLPSEFETVLFRIAQEALTNVARHARAAEAGVLLSFEPARVHLTISDNGRGFDPAEMIQRDQLAGWGLIGIQERALLLGGQCEIDSTPGGGTRIRVSVPVAAKEARDVANTTVVGR